MGLCGAFFSIARTKMLREIISSRCYTGQTPFVINIVFRNLLSFFTFSLSTLLYIHTKMD